MAWGEVGTVGRCRKGDASARLTRGHANAGPRVVAPEYGGYCTCHRNRTVIVTVIGHRNRVIVSP